jgi:hypothetical protein
MRHTEMTAIQSAVLDTSALRPLGLRVITWLLAWVTVMSGVIFAMMAAGLLPGDGLQAGLAQQLGVIGLLGTAIPAAVLVYGLTRERRWARPGVLACETVWVLSPMVVSQVFQVPLQSPVMAGVAGAAFILGIWWYLYRKRSVVEYYASLPRIA